MICISSKKPCYLQGNTQDFFRITKSQARLHLSDIVSEEIVTEIVRKTSYIPDRTEGVNPNLVL